MVCPDNCSIDYPARNAELQSLTSSSHVWQRALARERSIADTSCVAGESLTRAAADTGSQTRKESPHHVLQNLDSHH